MNMFGSYKVIEDESCLESIDNPEYSWIDVVLNWNPCNNMSRSRTTTIPSTQIYYAGEYMIAHPATIAVLKQQMKRVYNE